MPFEKELLLLLKAEVILREVGADTQADLLHVHIIELVRDGMDDVFKEVMEDAIVTRPPETSPTDS